MDAHTEGAYAKRRWRAGQFCLPPRASAAEGPPSKGRAGLVNRASSGGPCHASPQKVTPRRRRRSTRARFGGCSPLIFHDQRAAELGVSGPSFRPVGRGVLSAPSLPVSAVDDCRDPPRAPSWTGPLMIVGSRPPAAFVECQDDAAGDVLDVGSGTCPARGNGNSAASMPLRKLVPAGAPDSEMCRPGAP